MLRVDGIGYNVQEHQEVHMGHCKHYSKKCFLFFIFYFFKLGVVRKHGRKDVYSKSPNNCF